MDAKSMYSANVSAMNQIAHLDPELMKALERGIERAIKYHSNWEPVNINDIVNKFAPGSTPYQRGGKIVFENANHTIAVLADAAGGYLRIQDLTAKTTKAQYLTLDGKNGHNVTINGKTRGRTKAEYQQATHFRIKKLEEM